MATREPTRTDTAPADARLGFGVAAGATVAYTVFVLWRVAIGVWLPSGFDALWSLGFTLTLVLAPVAAGLAGYASFLALWLHGDTLPTRTRRLHLVTLLLTALVLVQVVSTWGSLAAWLD